MSARRTKPRPSVDRLRELFTLDEKTGVLRWRIARARKTSVGDVAGYPKPPWGYWVIGVDYAIHQRHILVWTMTTGSWPEGQLDHKDRTPGHDWFDNLRPATPSQQMANTRGYSKFGFPKGVHRSGENRYSAKIMVRGVLLWLGTFDSPEEAGDAYAKAALMHFGDFACSERLPTKIVI